MEMRNVGPKIERAEVDALEERLGVKLPEAYKEFLVEYNGGRPVPGGFRFFGQDVGSRVQNFFRVRGGERVERIEYAVGMFGERVPRDLFPIARDSGGNLVCIGVVGGAYDSRVVFWGHEGEADVGEAPVDDNLTLISEDFGSFLAGLCGVDL